MVDYYDNNHLKPQEVVYKVIHDDYSFIYIHLKNTLNEKNDHPSYEVNPIDHYYEVDLQDHIKDSYLGINLY